ncbi:MAG TPA: hypothetical protein PKL11_00915 [Anaerolineaceae bacterium]|nr:hypothetical protein [Anaerolineaceae bacterium]
MKKKLWLIPMLFIIVACGLLPPTTEDLDERVNATLTAIAQSNPPATVTPEAAVPTATQTAAPATAAPTLSLEQLRNGVYNSADWGQFQLTDGIYYRTPPTTQESPEAYTTHMLDLVLFGDIDGDGVEDAIVFLTTQSGGTGHFVEMAAVLNQNGTANNVSMLSLGDRVVVESGGIQAGLITLNLRVHGPNDGLCCPSQSATFTYRLDNQQLVQLP